MQKTVFLHVRPCKGAGNLQFSFVKKRCDRYNFPTINASVLNILLACASRISISSWQKSLSVAFHNCRIMQKTVLSYDPYGPARAFIAKLLRKSPYEGRTRWREQGRKKPSGPARIAYGPHTGIFSIVLQ